MAKVSGTKSKVSNTTEEIDLFGTAAVVEKKAAKSKKKVEVDLKTVTIAQMREFNELGGQIETLVARKEMLGGMIKSEAKGIFIDLYIEDGHKPASFNVCVGDEKSLFMPMDKYIKPKEEKLPLIADFKSSNPKAYDELFETSVVYTLNPKLLTQETMKEISKMIMGSALSDATKKGLIVAEKQTTVRKGAIEKLLSQGKKRETVQKLYDIIEPIVMLKAVGEAE